MISHKFSYTNVLSLIWSLIWSLICFCPCWQKLSIITFRSSCIWISTHIYTFRLANEMCRKFYGNIANYAMLKRQKWRYDPGPLSYIWHGCVYAYKNINIESIYPRYTLSIFYRIGVIEFGTWTIARKSRVLNIHFTDIPLRDHANL